MAAIRGKPWLRGLLLLSLVAIVVWGLITAPVNAAHTDAHVKQLALQVVKKNGGIFASFKNGPITVPSGGFATIASRNVPKGRYAIFAKLFVHEDGTPADVATSCRLLAGGDTDLSTAEAEESSTTGGAQIPMALQVTHRFFGPGTILLQCNDNAQNDAVSWVKIVAVRAPTLSNVVSPLFKVQSPE